MWVIVLCDDFGEGVKGGRLANGKDRQKKKQTDRTTRQSVLIGYACAAATTK